VASRPGAVERRISSDQLLPQVARRRAPLDVCGRWSKRSSSSPNCRCAAASSPGVHRRKQLLVAHEKWQQDVPLFFAVQLVCICTYGTGETAHMCWLYVCIFPPRDAYASRAVMSRVMN
jgi:hypothetical protein